MINAFTPMIAAARDPREAQHLADTMMYYIHQAKLPRRRQKISALSEGGLGQAGEVSETPGLTRILFDYRRSGYCY